MNTGTSHRGNCGVTSALWRTQSIAQHPPEVPKWSRYTLNRCHGVMMATYPLLAPGAWSSASIKHQGMCWCSGCEYLDTSSPITSKDHEEEVAVVVIQVSYCCCCCCCCCCTRHRQEKVGVGGRATTVFAFLIIVQRRHIRIQNVRFKC